MLIRLPALHANEDLSEPPTGYYLALDANGIQQVFQWVPGTNTITQITHTDESVLSFGVAYDGLSVAYISDNTLWLLTLSSDEVKALTPAQHFKAASPVFSPDGRFIAYPYHDVRVFDLETQTTRPLLVPEWEAQTEGFIPYICAPRRFLTDAEGMTDRLIVYSCHWEWFITGVYELGSDMLLELDNRGYSASNDLLSLADRRVLIYGSSSSDGSALYLAETMSEINTAPKVLNLATLTDEQLIPMQALEIAPGVVRMFGIGADPTRTQQTVFTFDYDVATAEAGEIRFFVVSDSMDWPVRFGVLSADGVYVPMSIRYEDAGVTKTKFQILTLETGDITEPLQGDVINFQWQP